jgi:nucleoside-diphosphate-sugar epimerase
MTQNALSTSVPLLSTVFGASAMPIKRFRWLTPPFPYCETKKMAEQWLFGFARSTHMEVTAIRPGNVFGPRDHTFIEKYLDALIAGKIAYIVGGDTGPALCTSKIW